MTSLCVHSRLTSTTAFAQSDLFPPRKMVCVALSDPVVYRLIAVAQSPSEVTLLEGSLLASSFSISFAGPSSLSGSVAEFIVEWSTGSGRRRATSIGRVKVRPTQTDPLAQVTDYLRGVTPTPYIVPITTGIEPDTE